MNEIKMVDLAGQYLRLKPEIDAAMQGVLNTGAFIQGPAVREFEEALATYQDVPWAVSCGNGTDALQIALMALGLRPADEVIVPAFTYVAPAEVAALLGITPVFVDVDRQSFNIDVSQLEKKITKKTKAIIPVHLYGQCADMEPVLSVAKDRRIHVVEDAAQSLGAAYTFRSGMKNKSGTTAVIGCTSFFPTKSIGAFGDGGAIFTRDEELAKRMRKIASHGQSKKYQHEVVGVNSRLDTLQAAVLNVKLKHIDAFTAKRQAAAEFYDTQLKNIDEVEVPFRSHFSEHIFHQYTIRVATPHRDKLKDFLKHRGVPAMIYYGLPLHFQEAYRRHDTSELSDASGRRSAFPVSEELAETVLSLPMHTELERDQQEYVCTMIRDYFRNV